MGLRGFFRDLEDDVKGELSDFDDSVRGALSDFDDQARENHIYEAIAITAAIFTGAAALAATKAGTAAAASGASASAAASAAASAGSAAVASGAGAISASAAGTAAGAAALAGNATAVGAAATSAAASVATGITTGQALMGLGSIASGIYGANQAKKAAKAQVEAGDRAAALQAQSADKQLALQREIWEKQQADYKPYLEQGTWSINRLGDLMRNQTPAYNASSGFNATIPMGMGGVAIIGDGGTKKPTNNANGGQLNNPFDTYLASKGLAGGQFNTNNPAYQFLLKQGQQALDRSAAARGMGYSGAQMKAAQQFGQGLASQEYDKQYNRASGEFGDYFNRLAGLSQGGQQAAGSMANAGSQYASNAGNTFGNLANAQSSILGQQANARASGYAARANAVTGGLNSLTNLYGMSQFGSGNKNSLGAWFNSDM